LAALLKRSKIHKSILIILIILCISIIFFNSSREGELSKQDSTRIVEVVEEITTSLYNNEPPKKISYFLKYRFSGILRDAAHIIEFLILGILVGSYFLKYFSSSLKMIFLPLLFCLVIALIDETIQIFSPGRAFEFYDLLLDTIGFLPGIFLISSIHRSRKVKNRYKKKKR
jgi:VanZ family protein